MAIYERLGVTQLIYAQTRASKIGGSLMHADVLQAMAQAAGSFVDMSQLPRKAADHIAHPIGVEAALIVNSAAAGLTVATVACVAGGDPDRIFRLPDTRGMNSKVILHRMRRIRLVPLAEG